MCNKNSFASMLCLGFLFFLYTSCKSNSTNTEKIKELQPDTVKINTQSSTMDESLNPVVYFEIPVTDIDRAVNFYAAVFKFNFGKEIIDKNVMALFPFTDKGSGISGALAKGDIYKPTKNGVVIYFKTNDIDETLKLVQKNGGQILYPKTSNGDLGYVAEFEDSEGNRIALHMKLTK
jgi:uncharacterized protein